MKRLDIYNRIGIGFLAVVLAFAIVSHIFGILPPIKELFSGEEYTYKQFVAIIFIAYSIEVIAKLFRLSKNRKLRTTLLIIISLLLIISRVTKPHFTYEDFRVLSANFAITLLSDVAIWFTLDLMVKVSTNLLMDKPAQDFSIDNLQKDETELQRARTLKENNYLQKIESKKKIDNELKRVQFANKKEVSENETKPTNISETINGPPVKDANAFANRFNKKKNRRKVDYRKRGY
jgi:hypothetical protein